MPDIQARGAPDSAAPRTQEAAAPVLALAVSLRRGIAAVGTSAGILLKCYEARPMMGFKAA